MSDKSPPGSKSSKAGKGNSDNRAALGILGLCGAGWAVAMGPSALDAAQGVDWALVAAGGTVAVTGSVVALVVVKGTAALRRAAHESRTVPKYPEVVQDDTEWLTEDEVTAEASAWDVAPTSSVPAGTEGASASSMSTLVTPELSEAPRRELDEVPAPEPGEAPRPMLDEAPRLIAALKLEAYSRRFSARRS